MLKRYRYLSNGAGETKKIAGFLAEEIFFQPPRISLALILALTGDLGSGKTTFIQGFCKGAGVKKRITSTTFIIFKKFQIPSASWRTKFKDLYHIDCYRVTSKELLGLGFREIINNPQNLVLIEWAEKIKKILPRNTIWIKFSHTKNLNQRKIKIM